MGRFHDRRFPGESAAYREARDKLLQAELDLRDRVEQVAALRRKIPLGGRLEKDYQFEELDRAGKTRTVRISELFGAGKDSLILYHFMYGPDWEKPCPMCTSVLDSLNGTTAYVDDRANLAVVAKAPIEKVRAWGNERRWDRLRLLSSKNNRFKNDYHAEFASSYGDQHPLLQVFVRRDDAIHHFWSSELLYTRVDGQPRHVDLVWPLWNLLDLTPEGRGVDWYPRYQM